MFYLRERLDFSSIALLIKENRGIDGLRDENFYHTMFDYALNMGKYKISQPDASAVSRYINGERAVTADTVQVYREEYNMQYLKQGVTNVLKQVADKERIVKQLEYLLQKDNTIPSKTKDTLLKTRTDAEQFVTDCMMYGMSRNFISKDKDGIREKEFEASDYLLDCYVPKPIKNFVGRDRELEEIHSRLSEESFLFLEGVGGIGKSEIAKHYAKQYKKEYENILYLHYHENLRHTIAELNFIDDKPEMTESQRFDLHFSFFQSLNANTLVILDNFNTTEEREELFYEFLYQRFLLLVTTRSHLEDVPVYPVGELNRESLLQLFYTYAPEDPKERHVISEIIKEVHCHTLTVEMAAKTLTACALQPRELLDVLQNRSILQSSKNKIGVTKDSHRKKQSMYEHLKTLFQLKKISKEKLDILRYMALMPSEGIFKRTFCDWLPVKEFDQINDLIETGRMKQEEEGQLISLHPLIQEIINAFEPPTYENCDTFFRGILNDTLCYDFQMPHNRHFLLAIKSILDIMEPKYSDVYQNTMQHITSYILAELDLIPSIDLSPVEAAFIELFHGIIALQQLDYATAGKHFGASISFLEPVETENLEFAANLHYYLGFCNLQQCFHSFKGEKLADCLFEDGKRQLDYALKQKAEQVSSDKKSDLISVDFTPISGDARYAKKQLENLIEKWSNDTTLTNTVWELYRILGELEFQTTSFFKAREWFTMAKLHYQRLQKKEDALLIQLDSRIQESEKLLNAVF